MPRSKKDSCSRCGQSMWATPDAASVRVCRPCRRAEPVHRGATNCFWCEKPLTAKPSKLAKGRRLNCGPRCQSATMAWLRGSTSCPWGPGLASSGADYVRAQCQWCGKTVTQHRDSARRGKRATCSALCRTALAQHDLGNIHQPWPRAKCTTCGARYVSNRGTPGACKDCRHAPEPSPKARKPRFVSACCPRCGAWWLSDRQGCNNQERYCSTKCSRADAKDRRRARKAKAYVAPVSRAAVFARDNYTCHLCGGKVDAAARAPHPKSPTIDHILPLARGGTHEPANVATAHFLCNARKGARGGGQLLLVG